MMEQFERFMSRHGEAAMQALVENWERHQGIRYAEVMTLEDRWMAFMGHTSTAPQPIAA